MSTSTKKRSSLDRKLKQLERETHSLEGEIKSLSKRLKGVGPTDTHAVQSVEVQTAASVGPQSPLKTNPSGELFDEMEASHKPRFSPPRPIDIRVRQHAYTPSRERSDQRFGSYLASGSFGGKGGRPLQKEYQIQRNKAVFMLIIVAILGFIVLKLVF